MSSLLSYYPFLPARVCFGPSVVLASSNQRLAIRRRLIISKAGYWGEVTRLVVELGSRVYDVICPFCHRADLFRPHSLSPNRDCRNSFPIEVAWMEEPVQLLGHRQTYIAKKLRLKRLPGGDRTAVPSDEILQSECSSTELAGPGLTMYYMY